MNRYLPFYQVLWWGLGCGGHFYWGFIRLGFPSQNVGGIDFLSPVTRSDMHVDFSYIRNLLVYASSSHCIPLLMNSSIV